MNFETNGDVVLDASPWSRGASRPNFMALTLKVQALPLALRAVLKIFGITLKLK